jgi:hypothetical protein
MNEAAVLCQGCHWSLLKLKTKGSQVRRQIFQILHFGHKNYMSSETRRNKLSDGVLVIVI